ncbi:lytic transglycosylase domain-containing protein [Pedobacter sp.]|uniref:lytic transglycosylase domain-containing protein n=1 Tax=Pedobacter sp. TaxID=1411316 RepID=UPI003D7F9CC2
MAKVFAYHLPQAEKVLVKQEKTVPVTITPLKEKEPVSLMAQLTFADESLPQDDHKVEKKMKSTLRNFSYAKQQTNRLHRIAAEWFPIIEPILEQYGIPEDFKYMPLVESGVRGGVSPKGAAGYWQFMPGTARSYGLKVNSKVDERNNLRKSTIAASKYIKELYGIFGNWTLVAAAYNVGDNHMRKQIKKQKENDYFKMKLNRETAGYVYKLVSMKQIMENPSRYGYTAPRELLAMNAK